MANRKISFGEFLLRTAVTNSSTLATLEIVAKFTNHDLTMDRATGLYSSGTVTLINPNDLGEKESIRFSAAAAASTATDSLGQSQYDLTVATADDASTKLRGLANDDNGTNSVNNVISGNMYAFPKNAIVRIAWDAGELQNQYDTFAQNSDEQTAELGETITERKLVALNTDDGKLYKYDTTDATHTFVGILKTGEGGSSGQTKTYIRVGGLATGFTQTAGKKQYASTSTAGDITETANAFLIGRANNDGTAISIERPESPTSFDDDEFDVHDEGDSTKKAVFSLGGATTAKTLTLISSHTDNRSITLPDSTGTLANIVDEDDMASDSAVLVPSQQSVKSYVDGKVGVSYSTLFETKENYTNTTTGTSTIADNAGGLLITTSAAGGDDAFITCDLGVTTLTANDFVLSSIVTPAGFATDATADGVWVGVSNIAAVIGKTTNLNGFFFIRESGALNLYGVWNSSQNQLLQTFSNSTSYKLLMTVFANTAKFYVNGTLQHTQASVSIGNTGQYLTAGAQTVGTDTLSVTLRSFSFQELI